MNETKQTWRDLTVWQESHSLVLDIYRNTAGFPPEEIYGLTSQVRRAAVSVPTNIVEGSARRTTKDSVNFLYTSRASLEEVRYLILLSQELQFLSVEAHEALENKAISVSKKLNALIAKLEQKK